MEKSVNLPKVHTVNKEQKFPLTNTCTDLENHLKTNHFSGVSQEGINVYLLLIGHNEK